MTVLLAHSPLLAAGPTWGELPARLGEPVLVPDVRKDETQPFAASYVAAVLNQVRPRWPTRSAVTAVAHSGAGPLLPALLAALQAAGTPVAEAIFLDAGLPTACLPGLPVPAGRLDLLDAEDPAAAAGLRELLGHGGRFPDWTAEQLAGLVPDPAAVVAGMRPRGGDFFAEPLPAGALPGRVRCGYVQLSETYRLYADRAAELGWPVVRAELNHFAALTDPDAVAALIRQVRAR
ncbi:MAG: hypothetical protein V7637_2549 [Mycobacteriales bacterium]